MQEHKDRPGHNKVNASTSVSHAVEMLSSYYCKAHSLAKHICICVNKAAEVLYYANKNWSRVVRKGQVQQWQSEAKQMAAAIKIAEAVKGWGVINPWAVTPWYGIQHCRRNSVVWTLCELMSI